jgi:cytoskeletal protein CcmA (bactofilin family)
MRLITLALAMLLPLTVVAQDIDRVNGDASVGPGEHAGDIHSVNGAVNVGAGAVVQAAGTVNGSVRLDDNAQASSLSTVNGSISLGNKSRVSGAVKSTNGDISMDPRADVAGSLYNVNGTISLDHAHVGGGIETTSGSITVGEGSRVDGGIVVNEVTSHGWNWSNHIPHVVIGPHAVVVGTLDFRRDVQLDVSDTAQIGPVKGAKVNTFHGASP